MAAQNWYQKFLTNPITTNQNDDLLYFARSPYGNTNDAVINWQNFSAQFAASVVGGYLPLSGGSMNGSLILHADATLPLEAVTYQQLQSVAAGFIIKPACVAATTANLSADYDNGTAGVGATLTNNSTQAAFALDGVSLSTNDRVLIKDQTATADNGIYTVTTVGDGSTNWVLTRATDYDAPSEIKVGDLVPILNGTVNGNSSWLQYDTVSVVGTDPIQFSEFTANPNSFLKVDNNLSDVASAASSRSNLGVAIGSDVEAWSAQLDSLAALASNGLLVRSAANTIIARTLAGTSNRIAVANGDGVAGAPTVDIDVAYVGQSSITTLGTITTGTWHGDVVTGTYGGTGVNNGSSTITYGGNVTFSGAHTFTGTLSADTSITFPTSGTLATTAQIPSTPISLANGGTGASLVASNGGIFYSTGTTGAILSGTATANQLLMSGASTNPTWSTATYPATAGTAGKILISDGTNIISSTSLWPNTVGTSGKFIISDGTSNGYSTSTIPSSAGSTANKVLLSDGTNYALSTPTFPNASATTGKFIRSDGTNWIASTPTLPVSAGTSGKVLQSDGTNYVESTPTYPSTSGSSGKILRSDGTNNVYSTSTFADTYSINTILYNASANTVSGLATANSGVLVTSGAGVPSISSTLPSGLTIPGYAASGANADITSMTGLTGYLQAPTGVKDSNGNIVVDFLSSASSVNYITLKNRATTQFPIIAVTGSDSAVGMVLATKNNTVDILDSTQTISGNVRLKNAANTHYTALTVATAQATNLTLTLPAADGSANYPMITDGAGTLSFALLPIAGGGTGVASSDPVIQRVSTINATSTTGSTTIPFDNTIPQKTEGDQYMTLSITPKNTNNILVIEASLGAANSAAGGSEMGMALFQDSTSNALAATSSIVIANQVVNCHLRYVMTAGTTSSTTFNIRMGSNSAGTTTTNGISGGRIYGGVMVGSIIITEYAT